MFIVQGLKLESTENGLVHISTDPIERSSFKPRTVNCVCRSQVCLKILSNPLCNRWSSRRCVDWLTDRWRGVVTPKSQRPDPTWLIIWKEKQFINLKNHFKILFPTISLSLLPSFLIITPYFSLPNSSDSPNSQILPNSQNSLLPKLYLIPIAFSGQCSKVDHVGCWKDHPPIHSTTIFRYFDLLWLMNYRSLVVGNKT